MSLIWLIVCVFVVMGMLTNKTTSNISRSLDLDISKLSIEEILNIIEK